MQCCQMNFALIDTYVGWNNRDLLLHLHRIRTMEIFTLILIMNKYSETLL